MPKLTAEKQECFKYLDELQKSGVTNMYGAAPYLQEKFKHLSHSRAVDILMEWMQTYSERHGKSVNDNSKIGGNML